MKITNEQKIKQIIMKPKAICFCPLGDDWYTNEFEIIMYPDKYFPDYCDLEKFLNETVRGKSLIIEDAVEKVYKYLNDTYKPYELEVTSRVNDVTSHSPVEVKKY